MAPSPTAVKRKEKIKAWIETNPLRLWRKNEGLAMMDVASSLDIAFSSIQQHEQGGYVPNEDTMAKYAGAMKLSPEKLERDWLAWYNNRPPIG
jgi:transcriptional regulator with XRE-family HTH domain